MNAFSRLTFSVSLLFLGCSTATDATDKKELAAQVADLKSESSAALKKLAEVEEKQRKLDAERIQQDADRQKRVEQEKADAVTVV